jgi:hypothetical protein
MLKLSQFCLFSCVLLAFIFSCALLHAQGRNIDPNIFKNQKPLTDSDISAIIQVETKANEDYDLDEEKYLALIKDTGLTEDRYNYVTFKINLGLLVESEQATRQDLLDHFQPRESIPTEAEQRLIHKRSAELLKLFNMD